MRKGAVRRPVNDIVTSRKMRKSDAFHKWAKLLSREAEKCQGLLGETYLHVQLGEVERVLCCGVAGRPAEKRAEKPEARRAKGHKDKLTTKSAERPTTRPTTTPKEQAKEARQGARSAHWEAPGRAQWEARGDACGGAS